MQPRLEIASEQRPADSEFVVQQILQFSDRHVGEDMWFLANYRTFHKDTAGIT